jgi:hypothetical protein
MSLGSRRSPYSDLPASAFWRASVRGNEPGRFPGIYRKKFEIKPHHGIATAGSCFAQHIARHLRAKGYRVLDVEPAPRWLSEERAQAFGYSIYSARYGNIYLARQLLQLVKEAKGTFRPDEWIWSRDGRFYDALRPGVEPTGLSSPEEVKAHRSEHLEKVRYLLSRTRLFIFTFGLTEGWVHKASGTVYPTAPGVIAGAFDPDVFEFKNFTAAEVLSDFVKFMRIAREFNPRMRFLVTVSPVPLAATASGNHVLAATIYSKSVLRAVAGQLYDRHKRVDYFPSYEIITSFPSRGVFYGEDMRNVTDDGVECVMDAFFSEHALRADEAPRKQFRNDPVVISAPRAAKRKQQELVCEEELNAAFQQ